VISRDVYLAECHLSICSLHCKNQKKDLDDFMISHTKMQLVYTHLVVHVINYSAVIYKTTCHWESSTTTIYHKQILCPCRSTVDKVGQNIVWW